MRRWISVLLVLLLVASAAAVAAAAEAESYVLTVVWEEDHGEVIPGGQIPVAPGQNRRLIFVPAEGYEVSMVLVDGCPVSYIYELRDHCSQCSGCDTCSWIDWSKVYSGFEGDDWSNWKEEVLFRNVSGNHTILVTFAAVKENSAEEQEETTTPVSPLAAFSDLDAGAWYADAVAYLLENGLMNGVGEGLFDPDGSTTRAQLVTMLWRLEGQPAVKYDTKFADVSADGWYADAVCWAASEGIVTGSNGKFAPHDPITREQLAAILWRYAKYRELDVSVGENTNILSYNDAFDVSGYAYPALQWTCGTGILNGSDGYLMPQGYATRVQTAAMLYRFCQWTMDS